MIFIHLNEAYSREKGRIASMEQIQTSKAQNGESEESEWQE